MDNEKHTLQDDLEYGKKTEKIGNREKHCRTWNMAKTLNKENEKCTLYMEYG
ncbi:hypothetical protein T10_11045 [Trichinella papuae]|uniref:Uncharacterized protein n=1 Tax=Trichinella papuae TaxID=268474 RepID=A0A0V1LWW7_9BILA|nr:hypothetical protein T10_11045 [Trichinella papuae]